MSSVSEFNFRTEIKLNQIERQIKRELSWLQARNQINKLTNSFNQSGIHQSSINSGSQFKQLNLLIEDIQSRNEIDLIDAELMIDD